MIDTENFDSLAYVTAACPAIGLRLSPERLVALAEAFALVVRVGAPALDRPIAAEDEPAPVFVA